MVSSPTDYNTLACRPQRSVRIAMWPTTKVLRPYRCAAYFASVLLSIAAIVQQGTTAAAVTVGAVGASDVDIDLDTVVNVISDEFVSYAIDSAQVLAMSEQFEAVAVDWQPAYVRIEGDHDFGAWTQHSEQLLGLSHWLSVNNLKPVITIPHAASDAHQFTARQLIPVLDAARTANLSACTWQLGSRAPDHLDPIAYADDLLALWHIRQALDTGRTWSVIGADLTGHIEPAAVQLYADLTDHMTAATSTRSPSMWQTLQPTGHPLWLHPASDADVTNESDAIERGLRFAHLLGTAAQTGYAAVFQPIGGSDLADPAASLSYYVSLLHKQLLGSRVLHTQRLSTDGDISSALFAHCSAESNGTGSFAVMGVNMAATSVRLATRLPANRTGGLVLQYVLRASADGLLFNERPARTAVELRPTAKTRKPNRPASFVMAGRTVSFWVFPEALVAECSRPPPTADTDRRRPASDGANAEPPSAAERLLEQLIRESVGLDTAMGMEASRGGSRTKRQLGHASDPPVPAVRAASALQRLFGKFELPKPKKLQAAMPLFQTLNNRPDLPPPPNRGAAAVMAPPVASVYDVYQKADDAEALFRSSENADLPKGDVYMEVGEENDQNTDYVAFDGPGGQRPAAQTVAAADRDIVDVEDDAALQHYPQQFLEFYDGAAAVRPPAADGADDAATDRRVHAELWEQRTAPGAGAVYNVDIVPASVAEAERRSGGQSAAVPKIVRGREPTWQENQDNLRKAKTALEGIYYTDGIVGGYDRRKKMTMPTSAEDERFFETRRRRRRRRAAADDADADGDHDDDDDDDDDDDVAAVVGRTEKPSNSNSVSEQLSPYQERLLLKMAKIMNQLQRMIGHNGVGSNFEPSAAMNTLADELRDIESYLAKNRKKPLPAVVSGFFGKGPASEHNVGNRIGGGGGGGGGFFGKQHQQSAQPLQQQLQQQPQQPTPPLSDDMPKRCKALALSLEQQCMRDIASPAATVGRPTRKRRFPRSLRPLAEHVLDVGVPDAWWWTDDDQQLQLLAHDERPMWAADDPRRNMIYKKGEPMVPFVAFVGRHVPAGAAVAVVPEDAPPAGGFAGRRNDDGGVSAATTPLPATMGTATQGEDASSTERYRSPRFMVTFSRSVEGLLDVVNQHVAGWWHMMS